MTRPTPSSQQPLRVWLNRSFSGTVHVIRALQQADAGYTVIASHTKADAPTLAVADEGGLEPPTSLSADDYLHWTLERCRTTRIDVLIPERHKETLAAARERFAAIGTTLLTAADAATLALLGDKARVYADLQGSFGAIPEHYPVTTIAELRDAYEAIVNTGRRVCFKPAVGVFGSGFRIIGEETLEKLLGGTTHVISWEHLERLLAPHPTFPTLLVMPVLEGVERSIDVLACEGHVAAAVVRAKPLSGYAQHLEDNPNVLREVRTLVARYRLNGLVNVQFKDDVAKKDDAAEGGAAEGGAAEDDAGRAATPYLLEINTRASGGLFMALEAGVNLPHYAVQLATGRLTPDDVPEPTLGGRIAQITAPLPVVPEAVASVAADVVGGDLVRSDLVGGDSAVATPVTPDVREPA